MKNVSINKRNISVIFVGLTSLLLVGCTTNAPSANSDPKVNPLIYLVDVANSLMYQSPEDAMNILINDGWEIDGIRGMPSDNLRTLNYSDNLYVKKVGLQKFTIAMDGNMSRVYEIDFEYTNSTYGRCPFSASIIKDFYRYIGNAYTLNSGTVCNFDL